jgi:hypothetical protein
MFILARGGKNYGRLRFNIGPGAAIAIESQVDYHAPFTGSNEPTWAHEHDQNVLKKPWRSETTETMDPEGAGSSAQHLQAWPDDWLEDVLFAAHLEQRERSEHGH